MKPIKILSILSCSMMLFSCGKEAPFNVEPVSGEGHILKSALNVDLRDGELGQTTVRSTRADISYDDFKVIFTKEGAASPSSTYRYGEMPEIVSLEQGVYVAKATYGENLDAEWDNPYYVGQSDAFSIRAGEITDNIGEIVCRLENIKVSINFAPILTQQMSESSFVEVKVVSDGQNAKGLRFTKFEENRGISGYFRYEEGVSLVATFSGMVEGLKVSETKSIPVVDKGNHYKITFKLHNQAGENQGDVDSDMKVDASVTVTNVERNVDLEDDEILDDSERPSEGEPDEPTPPVTEGPSVIAENPIDLDKVNNVSASSHVVLNIASETGITEFKVNIISEDLAGLVPEVLDLVNPGDNLNLLQSLGLLQDGKTSVQGDKDVKFDVSGFMVMLCGLGEGKDHTFKLTVGDSSGTVVKELRLHTITE